MTAGEPVYRLDPLAVEWRLVDDEVVVLDTRGSRYLAVNRSGASLWPLLAAGTTRAELSRELSRKWGLSFEAADDDVGLFIAWLVDAGLVETPSSSG
ncbi:MAG: PqqD family protein [Acidimicrobiales bacterium]